MPKSTQTLTLVLATLAGVLYMALSGEETPHTTDVSLVANESSTDARNKPAVLEQPATLEVTGEAARRVEPTAAKPEAKSSALNIHVFGRVVRADGAGLTGISVSMYSVGEAWLSGDVPQPSMRQKQSTTDGSGYFDFEMVQPDSTWITLDIRPGPDFTLSGRDFGPAGGRNKEPLHAGENDLGDFVLAQAGAIGGQVFDLGGNPISGSRISLDGSFPGGYSLGATTLEDGTFTIGNIPAGRYVPKARAEGFLSQLAEGVDVSNGATTLGTRFALESGPTIRGRVVDKAGMGIAGVRIWGWPQGGGRGAGATSEADGAFQMNLPQPDPYSITLEHSGYLPLDSEKPRSEVLGASTASLNGATQKVFAPGASGVLVRLIAPPLTTLLVVDADTNQPIERFGLVVDEVRHGGQGNGWSSSWRLSEPAPLEHHEGGRWLGLAEPAYDDYAIHATGYGPQNGRVAFDVEGARTQTIRMQRGGVLMGKFMQSSESDGAPSLTLEPDRVALVEGANPEARDDVFSDQWGSDMDQFAGLRRQFQGAADGSFKIDSLAQGTYILTLSVQGIAPLAMEGIRIEAGATTDLGQLFGKAPSAILGTVMMNGVPVEGAEVSLGDEWFGDSDTVRTTRADGSFSFLGLAAGTHWLWIEGQAGKVLPGDVFPIEVQPEEELTRIFDVSDRMPGRLEIQVTIRGIPTADLQIKATAVGGEVPPQWLGLTDAAGTVVKDVPANALYTIVVRNRHGMAVGTSPLGQPHAPGAAPLVIDLDPGRLRLHFASEQLGESGLPPAFSIRYRRSDRDGEWNSATLRVSDSEQSGNDLMFDLGFLATGEYEFKVNLNGIWFDGSASVIPGVEATCDFQPTDN